MVQIGYWAPGQALAVVYAVAGEGTIPAPGLVPLGHVHTGLAVVSRAGDTFEVTIEHESTQQRSTS